MRRIIFRAVSVLLPAERAGLFRIILLNTFISILDIASLAVLLALVHYYSQQSNIPASRVENFIQGLEQAHFLLPIILGFSLFVFKNSSAFLLIKYQYRFIYKVAARISTQNMFRYLDSDYYEYSRVNPSVHISRISYQPTEFSTFILSGIQQLFTEGVLTTLAIIAILIFNAKLFLLLLLIILPPLILSAYYSKKRLDAARGNVKINAENTTQFLNEALSSFIESNVFNKKSFFAKRFSDSQQKLSQRLSDLQIVQAVPPRLMELFAVLGLLVLITINYYSGHTNLELLNIGALMAAVYKIIPGIARIANVSGQLRMYSHTIEEVRSASAFSESMPEEIIPPISSIQLQNVSVLHDDQVIFKDLNLTLTPGDFLGVSADSGKGKTTLINLMLGFLKEQSGKLYINGVPVSPAERKQFLSRISLVKQQAFIIDDTILKNITLADITNEEQMEFTVNFSGLRPFIQSFPEGLEKRISDAGKNISGGQRQRIALARALYKDADILILDEPFSELDRFSENKLLVQLKELSIQGKIIILITHNKESLSYCNKTLFLHD